MLTGYHDDNHYTCAFDLYLIAKEAMKYDAFRSIVAKTSYTLPATNKYSKDDRVFRTTNDLIRSGSSNSNYYKYAIGIKTGYTSQAKDCLVAAASKDDLEFYTVILGSERNSNGVSKRFSETKQLFNFAFDNYSFRLVKSKNTVLKQIEIDNATYDTKKLDLLMESTINVLVDNDNLYTSIVPEISLKDNLKAPISKGDIVGTVKYVVDGTTYQSNLIANSDVKQSFLIFYVIGIAVIVLAIFIIIRKFSPKKSKNRRVSYKNYKI